MGEAGGIDSGHCPLLVTSGESPSLQVSRSKKLSREASPLQSPPSEPQGGRAVSSLCMGRAPGPDRLTAIPLPLFRPCMTPSPCQLHFHPEFPFFSDWSRQGLQALADSSEEGVGWRKWTTSMPIPGVPHGPASRNMN